MQWKFSEGAFSKADSSSYGHIDKTPFFLTSIQTLYFYIPVSGQLQLDTFLVSWRCPLMRASTVWRLDIGRVWSQASRKSDSINSPT